MGSRVMFTDVMIISPVLQVLYKETPSLLSLPTISSLVIYMLVNSKYHDRVPASEQTQMLLQGFTECLLPEDSGEKKRL